MALSEGQLWNIGVIVSAISTFVTVICGQIVGYFREQRQRRWLEADRDRAAADRKADAEAASVERAAARDEIIARAKAEAEALRIKTDAAARALRVETARIASKLDTVHKVAVETKEVAVAAKEDAQVAYTESNGLNAKNAELRQEILAIANGTKPKTGETT